MIAVAAARDRVFELENGRRLRYCEFGDGGGRPILALHGTPGSRLKFEGLHETARLHQLRLICVDRWGYGGSDAPRIPLLADYSSDVAELMDALGVERFGVLGVSGGGPFAAVSARQLHERVIRLALVCPLGPITGEKLSGISVFHRFCLQASPAIPMATRTIFAVYRLMLKMMPATSIRLSVILAAADDKRLMKDPVRRRQVANNYLDGLAGPQYDGQIVYLGGAG